MRPTALPGGGDALRLPLPGGGDLVARPGAVIAVCGENGAGFDALEEQVTDRIVGSPTGPAVAWIGRRRALSPRLDVAENVFLGCELTRRRGFFSGGIDWRHTRTEATALLSGLGCTVPPYTPASELGEHDRLLVELAHARARDARLIVLEEPTARLTDAESGHLIGRLRRLTDDGCAVLVLTQKPRQAIGYADEIVVLRDGAVVGRHAAAAESAGPGATESLRRSVLREMVGRDYGTRTQIAGLDRAEGAGVGATRLDEPELLRIDGWSASDPLEPQRLLVEGAGLVVRAGEIVGLAGLRDSGADELLLSVYGRSEGASATGTVAVRGEPVDTSTVERAIAAGLFLATTGGARHRVRFVGGLAVPVAPSALPALVSLGLVDRDSDTAAGDGVADRMLGAVRGLGRGGPQSDHVRGYVSAFPESERSVLLLSSPTSGMTAVQRAAVHEGLRAIAAAGKGVVLASPDLAELLHVCDRVVTMAGGRVTGEVRDGDVLRIAELIAPG